MNARASLNLATIKPASFEQKLYAARTAGFSAVGLFEEEIAREGEEGKQELRLNELKVSELIWVSEWMSVERTARSLVMLQAEKVFELAMDLGCDQVVVWPETGTIDPMSAVGCFRELCRLAKTYHTRIGLEFLGFCEQIKSVTAAWEIIDLAGADNGGLVIDTFHYYLGRSTLEMLEPVPGEKIFLVQVSDCVELPRYELNDSHRVYPGEGVIPLEPLLAMLRDKAYTGYYSLELGNENYWAEDPITVARDGLGAMRRLGIV